MDTGKEQTSSIMIAYLVVYSYTALLFCSLCPFVLSTRQENCEASILPPFPTTIPGAQPGVI